LARLRRLKEREQELPFELFKARLSAEDLERLERKARAQVEPHLGWSIEWQLEVHKDTILRQWSEKNLNWHALSVNLLSEARCQSDGRTPRGARDRERRTRHGSVVWL
jgi:hypothetical protein